MAARPRCAEMEGDAQPVLLETLAGIIKADVNGSRVKLQLPKPYDLKLDVKLSFHEKEFIVHCINTGVPHAIIFQEDLDSTPVYEWGRLIRHDPTFKPAGTNVNFVKVSDRHNIVIRTYERGVEDETQACGTGAVASAILSAKKGFTESPVKVTTWGGEQLIAYFKLGDPDIKEVFLDGETVLVYSGVLDGDLR